MEGDDPFFVRFKVTPVVWLTPDQGIPIHDPEVWSQLTMTREHKHNSPVWTGFFRTSLNRFDEQDGHFLEEILRRQAASPRPYALTDHDRKRLVTHVVKRTDGPISVVVPDDNDQEEGHLPDAGKSVSVESRESIRVQAMLSKIGVLMGLKIWPSHAPTCPTTACGKSPSCRISRTSPTPCWTSTRRKPSRRLPETAGCFCSRSF